ncbi:MAG: DEAD/DEAH box helicase [Gammaproteobacteria bacterium]|nr:DEAD/DEAH box helicase [Gammaproteobacteria bacterium]
MKSKSASALSFGAEPGQDLGEVAKGLTRDQLRTVLGDDVINLITACVDEETRIPVLNQVAATILRDRVHELVSPSEIREICINHLSAEKRKELAQRLTIANTGEIRDLDFRADAKRRNALLGFFGVDVHGTVAFAKLPGREPTKPGFGLFGYQRNVVKRVQQAIRGGHGRVVVHMPTGTGKTRTAMHLVCKVIADNEPCSVVWLAASKELLEQASEAFQHAWSQLGSREINIVRYWGDYLPDLSDSKECFVVAGLQKLHAFKRRNPIGLLKLAKEIRLVVVDEAHQAIAPTYRKLITTLADTGSQNALVGLTATPGRTWADIEADEELSDFFDRTKVTLEIEGYDDPVSYLLEKGYLARPKFRKLYVETSANARQSFRNAHKLAEYDSKILDILSQEVHRNLAIVDEIRSLIQDGHTRILFFSASVRHAEVISAILLALGIDSYVVTGKTDKTARRRIIEDFRVQTTRPKILCNFGVLTTGFDAPITSAAVIARPTKSLVLFSQMVGRATRGRMAGGNDNCVVSTIVDTDLPGFGDMTEAFTNWEDVWNEPN